jgi:hypothetical protein
MRAGETANRKTEGRFGFPSEALGLGGTTVGKACGFLGYGGDGGYYGGAASGNCRGGGGGSGYASPAAIGAVLTTSAGSAGNGRATITFK